MRTESIGPQHIDDEALRLLVAKVNGSAHLPEQKPHTGRWRSLAPQGWRRGKGPVIGEGELPLAR